MNYKKDTKKGKYRLINPKKYLGTKYPVYKSKWEQKVFYALDRNPFVLQWGYECIEIYYHHPFYGNYTVYYPDILCHVLNERNQKETILAEIKPASMCVMPNQPKAPKNRTRQSAERYQKSLRRYQCATKDFQVNAAKWEAAQRWCMRHNVVWRLIHENNTSGLFKEGSI